MKRLFIGLALTLLAACAQTASMQGGMMQEMSCQCCQKMKGECKCCKGMMKYGSGMKCPCMHK